MNRVFILKSTLWLWNRDYPFQSDFWISDDILLSVNKQSGLLNREGFLGSSAGKESASSAGEPGLIPGLRRSPGGEHGNPLQYSCLKNPHGQRSLVGYSPWGWKESHTTAQLSTALNRERILWMFPSLFNLIQGKFHFVSWVWVDSLVLLSGTSVKLLLMNRNNREKKHAINNCYHFWMPLIMPPNTETVGKFQSVGQICSALCFCKESSFRTWSQVQFTYYLWLPSCHSGRTE